MDILIKNITSLKFSIAKQDSMQELAFIENGIDTGKDAFMRDFPQLIDVGVMG